MATMRERVAELEARRAKVREMGGAEKVQKHHDRGKLTARERLALLFDGGAFTEIGIHGTEMGPGEQSVPADAVVCGWGTVDGRYVLDRKLGEGAMGTVYLSHHTKLDRLFAVKVLHRRLLDSAKSRKRFEREAELTSRLSHHHVVRVVDG
jgi:acetyl-CoA carboxylase carboxyltransferase component